MAVRKHNQLLHLTLAFAYGLKTESQPSWDETELTGQETCLRLVPLRKPKVRVDRKAAEGTAPSPVQEELSVSFLLQTQGLT